MSSSYFLARLWRSLSSQALLSFVSFFVSGSLSVSAYFLKFSTLARTAAISALRSSLNNFNTALAASRSDWLSAAHFCFIAAEIGTGSLIQSGWNPHVPSILPSNRNFCTLSCELSTFPIDLFDTSRNCCNTFSVASDHLVVSSSLAFSASQNPEALFIYFDAHLVRSRVNGIMAAYLIASVPTPR